MSEDYGYSLATIMSAFFLQFHEAGACWFPHVRNSAQDEANNLKVTTWAWEAFAASLSQAQLARLWCAKEAIRKVIGSAGYLHIILDDRNVEDAEIAEAEAWMSIGDLELTADAMADQRACLKALRPLTTFERQQAIEEVEGEDELAESKGSHASHK